jgi:hypothetical protein
MELDTERNYETTLSLPSGKDWFANDIVWPE